MSLLQRLSTWAIILAGAALLAVGWVTTALAQVGDGDGDGFDGDELLSLPIVLGVGVLAIVGWFAYRRRSPKSGD